MNKRKLTRRSFLQFTGGALGLAALAACAPAAPGGETAAGGEAATEQTTVSLGLTWDASFQPTQNEFNDNFMERHPDIKLDVIYNTWSDYNNIVPTWAAANTLPDIIYVHGSRSFPWSFEGMLTSLQGYVDEDQEFNVDGIWEESLRLYRFKGNLHAIPYDHGPILLGYNKDLFDAAGLPYPDETWNMDTLREVSLQLTDLEADIPKWGYSGESPVFQTESGNATWGGWGAQLLSEGDAQLLADTDEMRAAVQYWVDLIHTDKSSPTPSESQAFEQGPWMSGQVAMANVPSWETPGLAEFAAFAWDVAPWPEGPVTRSTGSFGSGFSITKESTNPDAGWAYLREYLSTEGMEFMWGSTGRGSPARKDAYESWMNSEDAPEHAVYYLDALESYAVTGRPYETLAAAELIDVLVRQETLLKSGETDVTSAIAAIMAEGQPVLDEANERMQASA